MATVLDVPEELIRWEDSPGAAPLIATILVPLKILQALSNVVRVVGLLPARTSSTCHSTKRKRVFEELKLRERTDVLVADIVVPTLIRTEPFGDVHQDNKGRSNELDRNLRAAKNDNARVPVELWDDLLAEGLDDDARSAFLMWCDRVEPIRRMLISHWRRRLLRGYVAWRTHHLGEDPLFLKEAQLSALDAIRRAADSSFWEWPQGSRPFFWNWPSQAQRAMVLGMTWWLRPNFCPVIKAQTRPPDETTVQLVTSKLDTVRTKGYLEMGPVDARMFFFHVPKGNDDIRMVYDGTASGLNDYLWAPWFLLPTVDTLLRGVEAGTFMCDNDVGEMFLNFVLHEDIRRLCGVDVGVYYPDESGGKALVLRWNRPPMGLKPSPYTAVKWMLWAHEIILGDCCDAANVFRWHSLQLNLPGSPTYDPGIGWVTKRRRDGSLAADLFLYVDDLRLTGPTARETWQAAQRVSSVLASLGLQDAARKRRPPSTEPGAWAGSVVYSSHDTVHVLVSQERWDKTRRMLGELIAEREGSLDGKVDFKGLESKCGFLIYVARTYPAMKPYLKGFHATLNSWRPDRDYDGWKVPGAGKRKRAVSQQSVVHSPQPHGDEGMVEVQAKLGQPRSHTTLPPPKRVRAVPRFRDDLDALVTLTSGAHPTRRQARPTRRAVVRYGFGDASGSGFGSSIFVEGKGILWRQGLWNWTIKQEMSSNFRELCNLVEALESAAASDVLTSTELWMFTDNSTAEAAYFGGTSKSRHLFELVLRLRKLEMSTCARIFLVHVAGTRMIWQGTDGLSRGDHAAGVMAGNDMLQYIPIHLDAFARSEMLRDWVSLWADPCSEHTSGVASRSALFLKPNGWPVKHEGQSTYIWSPAPAAASAAVEFMAYSIHKRSQSTHIIIVPRLMTAWWFKVLSRAADVVFTIPLGTPVWEKDQHEPLICALCFPLSSTEPWRMRGTPRAERFLRELQGVWSTDFGRARSLLRQLLGEARCYGDDSGLFPIRFFVDDEGEAVIEESDRARFCYARAGDQFMCRFQCDVCHFRNLTGVDVRSTPQFDLLMKCIRRASLDALWAREPSTVAKNRQQAVKLHVNLRRTGIVDTRVFPALGPLPVEDKDGMGVAVAILLRSLDPGRTTATIQFSTATALRSAYTSYWQASIQGAGDTVAVRDMSKMTVTTCPAYSDWFDRFTKGMHKRMGDQVVQNEAVTIQVMMKLMELFDRDWAAALDSDRNARGEVIFPALACVVGFCAGLRGEELPMVHLGKVRERFQWALELPEVERRHVVVALVGRFKMVDGEHCHFLPLAIRTDSGLEPGPWMARAIRWWEEGSVTTGKIFRRRDGRGISATEYDFDFCTKLEEIQRSWPELIEPGINVFDRYSIRRSLRRGSNSRAVAAQVSDSDINMNNRWRQTEKAAGRRPRLNMIELYTDMVTQLNSLLRYSQAL